MQKKKINLTLLQLVDCRDEYKEKRCNEAGGGLSSQMLNVECNFRLEARHESDLRGYMYEF